MNKDSSWQVVARAVSDEIERLPPGARVPSQRRLVERFGASATTVSRALAELGRRGLVEARPGSGTFRTETRATPPPPDTSWQTASLGVSPAVGSDPAPGREYDATALSATVGTLTGDVIELNGGYLHPSLQPAGMLAKAVARVGRRAEAWGRPDPAGLPELRDWFAGDIGPGLTRHDVLVTAGGQAALSLIMRAVGRPGDPVLIETPGYPGALAAARSAGLRVVPVPTDPDGIRPEHLERALAQTGARLVVVQPVFANPTGASLTVDRQRELLDLLRQHGAFVVEDDFARHLAHADSPALPAALAAQDPDGAVIHIRSLTKSTSPNLRVAGVTARGPVMALLRAAHLIDTMFVPALLQYTALEVVTGPAWLRHLRTLGADLVTRRAAAADAVWAGLGANALDRVPRGGYHLWLRLPAGVDDREAAAAALRRGVAVTPGANYDPTGAATGRLRISYVAAPSVPDLVRGLDRLAGTWDD